jgi:hypothetical protein
MAMATHPWNRVFVPYSSMAMYLIEGSEQIFLAGNSSNYFLIIFSFPLCLIADVHQNSKCTEQDKSDETFKEGCQSGDINEE